MENTGIGKYTRSFGLSFAITSVLSALLVILKESNEETVLAWMKAATGHHWVTHGIFNLIVFVGLGWALSRLDNGQGLKITANILVICIVCAVFVSGLIITGFYI
jgi:lipoprotein signal peptidase